MEAVVIGANKFPNGILEGGVQYVLDLLLLKTGLASAKSFKTANPVCQEIIPRALNSKIQQEIESNAPKTFAAGGWMDLLLI